MSAKGTAQIVLASCVVFSLLSLPSVLSQGLPIGADGFTTGEDTVEVVVVCTYTEASAHASGDSRSAAGTSAKAYGEFHGLLGDYSQNDGPNSHSSSSTANVVLKPTDVAIGGTHARASATAGEESASVECGTASITEPPNLPLFAPPIRLQETLASLGCQWSSNSTSYGYAGEILAFAGSEALFLDVGESVIPLAVQSIMSSEAVTLPEPIGLHETGYHFEAFGNAETQSCMARIW